MTIKMKAGLLRGILALSTVALGLLPEVHAQAQGQSAAPPVQPVEASADNPLQEVVVTAQKRSTSLQKTPLAVTALSGEALQQEQVRSLEDINGLVPTLKMGDVSGYAQITIRGIGIDNVVPLAESAVAVNLNEVYVSRPVASLAGLYDISDLEVLRGPQGTLYGRNATAGAVNLTTTRPTNQFSGYGNVTVGDFGETRFEGAIGGPVIDDKVLFRIAGFRETRDGYGTNILTHHDVDDKNAYGVRGTLVVTPTSSLKVTLVGELYNENDDAGGIHYLGAAGLTGLPGAIGIPPVFVLLGGPVPSNPYDLANQFDPKFELRTTAVTGIVEWSSDPFSVKSITGYRHQSNFSRANIAGGDPGGAYALFGEPAHQFSQELQAHYDISSVHLTGGLFYFDEHDDYAPASVIVDNAALNLAIPGHSVPGFTQAFDVGGLQTVTAKAAFGEATVNVTDQLSLTAGIRYSTERKQLFNQFALDFFAPYTGNFLSSTPLVGATELPSRTFDSTTPKFGIQYQLDPQTLVYATYAKGFKSGGFAVATDNEHAALGYNPEKLTDYEGGLKTTLFDHRVRLNLAGFYYDYTDLQVNQAIGNTVVTTNAASAHVYGAEAELTAALTRALTIDSNFSWLHARYADYVGADNTRPLLANVDFGGKSLNNAPDFQGHLAASYKWEVPGGDLLLRAEAEYSSQFFFSPANLAEVGQGGFTKANAFLTYTAGSGWHARAFVRNLTDKTTRSSAFVTSALFGTPVVGSLAPPRTFGLELGYDF